MRRADVACAGSSAAHEKGTGGEDGKDTQLLRHAPDVEGDAESSSDATGHDLSRFTSPARPSVRLRPDATCACRKPGRMSTALARKCEPEGRAGAARAAAAHIDRCAGRPRRAVSRARRPTSRSGIRGGRHDALMLKPAHNIRMPARTRTQRRRRTLRSASALAAGLAPARPGHCAERRGDSGEDLTLPALLIAFSLYWSEESRRFFAEGRVFRDRACGLGASPGRLGATLG